MSRSSLDLLRPLDGSLEAPNDFLGHLAERFVYAAYAHRIAKTKQIAHTLPEEQPRPYKSDDEKRLHKRLFDLSLRKFKAEKKRS